GAFHRAHGVGLAEHLHVAAEGNDAELPAGAVAVGVAEQFGPESHRECLAAHAAAARHHEVPHLVHEHDDGQDEDETHQGEGNAQQFTHAVSLLYPVLYSAAVRTTRAASVMRR